jgi:regulator of sigma E protease
MMEAVALKVLGFLLALGILVTVHEFGHFWVARRLGVKVLRFSIGFGRPLLRWRRKGDDTEYVVAAIPLGGYVKMVDEREGEVAEADLPHAFNRRPVWVRTAVVLAGPLFNFLFAVVMFWAVLVLGETGLRPLVGEVAPNSVAAQAGFHPGDEILSVNGEATPTWTEVLYQVAAASASGDPIRMVVKDKEGKRHQRRLPAEVLGDLAEVKNPLETLGFKPALPEVPAVIGKVLPGEPAQQAGLRPGDRILAVDGKPVKDWVQWVQFIRAHPGQPIRMEVARGAQRLELTVTPKVVVTEEGETIGRIGAANEPVPNLWEGYQVTHAMGPLEAFPRAVSKTWEFSALTLKVMWRILTGEASLKNLGGPITMADAAGSAVSAGLVQFLKLLAVISVSLGVFNLLPIPVLDGGHLLFFAYEGITGKPPSEAAMARGQQIGLALLLALMVLVFYQDILRLSG